MGHPMRLELSLAGLFVKLATITLPVEPTVSFFYLFGVAYIYMGGWFILLGWVDGRATKRGMFPCFSYSFLYFGVFLPSPSFHIFCK